MTHHLADLITLAERESSAVRRAAAQRNAVSTSLRVWEYRRNLPGRGNPLAPYEDLLRFLALIRPESSAFGYSRGHAKSRLDEVSAQLFDAFSRLLGVLLLIEGSHARIAHYNSERAAVRALSRDERQLLSSIRPWMQLVVADTPPKRQRKPRRS